MDMNEFNVFLIALIVGLGQVLKGLGLDNKYLPLISLIMGVIAGVVFVPHGDLKMGILTGIMIGLSSVGLYSGSKNAVEDFLENDNNKGK